MSKETEGNMQNPGRIPIITLILCISAGCLFADDYWIPKGGPNEEAGKMKTMEQVEPRTIVTNPLPYYITNSGSFYLTQSMNGSDGNYGIIIATNEVKLDLNGFSLNGTTGSLDGIKVTLIPSDNISIRNGVIRNWGDGFGVNATSASDVVMQDLKAFRNGWGGLYAGQNALLERCSVYGCGSSTNAIGYPPKNDAIQVGSFSTIIDCKARGNTGTGIHSYGHSRVIGCTAVLSTGATGINLEDYCTVKDCTVSQNKIGISVGNKSRVSENTVGDNGNNPWAGNYNGPGIFITGDNNVIERNIISYNNTGIKVSGLGNLIMNNYISKSRSIGSWNPDLYIVNSNNFIGGAMSTNTYDEVTNSNPWMNFKLP